MNKVREATHQSTHCIFIYILIYIYRNKSTILTLIYRVIYNILVPAEIAQEKITVTLNSNIYHYTYICILYIYIYIYIIIIYINIVLSLYSWKSIKPRLRLFKWYPEKQLICQDVKCLSERETGKTKVPRLDYLRSQDRNLHIPQIYCDTFLPTNSKSRPFRSEGADVSHTHTKNPLNRTLRLWGFRLCASTWCAMIVNDRKTNFTTWIFRNGCVLIFYRTASLSGDVPKMHILPLRARECVFSSLLFFSRSCFFPLDPVVTSYRLTSSLEQTPGALAQVNWTWQFSGSPNPMPPPSSSSSSSPLDVKSARGSCWLLMLHTAWTKHTHTKQHKEELCIKCRSNIWQVTVVSVSGFLGAAVMCSK